MEILELNALTPLQMEDVLRLMGELSPSTAVSEEMVRATVEAAGTHFFAMMDERRRIVGCASLCEFFSPTGRKASVEDVVVLSSLRGQHLGRKLMQHVLDFARRELSPVDLHLTSRPQRVAANALYRSLGFERRETKLDHRKPWWD